MRISTSIFLVAAFAAISPAHAQTCATPDAWHPSQFGTPALTGTTCGHETGIVSVCQGSASAPHEAYVVQIFVAAAGNFFDITFGGGTGYTLSAYLVPVANGCNADGACTTVGDASTHMIHGDIPDGSYYLIITGADFDAPGACGTFSAAVNGSLPVSLQAFTID